MPRLALSCFTLACFIMLYLGLLYHALPWRALSCFTLACFIMFYLGLLYHAFAWHAFQSLVSNRIVLVCFILFCSVVFCSVLFCQGSCRAITNVLSCPALSCLVNSTHSNLVSTCLLNCRLFSSFS